MSFSKMKNNLLGENSELSKNFKIMRAKEWDIGDKIFDVYTILDVKSGGMGNVYIAEHEHRKQIVAIKSPNEKMLADGALFGRVIREAQQWIDLGLHPHIAYCYYVRQINEIPHIFIEYIDGGNLRDWIRAERCQDMRIALDIAIQFCHGMEYAQQYGMVHRDIKPENILMTKSGTLKITDFGLARMTGGVAEDATNAGIGSSKQQEQLTMVGQKGVGTAAYMAPEQYLDLRSVDTRADIYSFGVCLYEMFCGCRPYEYESREVPPSILAKYQGHKPIDPRTRQPEIPTKLAALLERCCALNKGGRYNSFNDLRRDLLIIYRDLYLTDPPHAEIQQINLKADGLNNRGVSYWDLGREEDAQNCWEAALREDPQHLAASFNLGYFRWHRADLGASEFLTQLKMLERIHKFDSDYWQCLAWVYYEQGYVEEINMLQQSRHAITDADFLRAIKYKKRPSCREVKVFDEHLSKVNAVCFSPDGKYILTGGGEYVKQYSDNSALLWKNENGRLMRKFVGHENPIYEVAFFASSRYVLTKSNDSTAFLWERKNGKALLSFEYTSCFSLAPNCKLALIGGGDNSLTLWNVQKTQKLCQFDAREGCFTPDSRYLLTVNDCTAQMWDAKDWHEVRSFRRYQNKISSINLSSDGRYALISYISDKITCLWELKTGFEIRQFEGFRGCFSPNGLYVFTSNLSLENFQWDLESGQLMRQFKHNFDAFSPDGQYYLSTNAVEGSFSLFSTGSGREIRSFQGHKGAVSSVCFSPEGQFVLSGGEDKTARLWECSFIEQKMNNKIFPLLSKLTDSAKLLKEQKEVEQVFATSHEAALRSDWRMAHQLMQKIGNVSGYARDERVLDLLWQSGSQGKGRRIRLQNTWKTLSLKGHEDAVKSVCFSPDGRQILTGSFDNTAKLWDTKNGKVVCQFPGTSDGVNSVNFSPDGRNILIASDDGYYEDETLKLWNIETGKEIIRFKGHIGHVWSAVFSPCGRYIISGGDDNTVRLWECKSGRQVRIFSGHEDTVNSVVFSPKGDMVLAGSDDNTARLWNVTNGRELRIFKGHTQPVKAVSFSSDGTHLMTASADTTARLWKRWSFSEIHRFSQHTGSINSVCFSPDGRNVLTGSEDATARLWDTESGNEVRLFQGHVKSVNSACFSPDGRYVLTGSSDCTALLWELEWKWEFMD